VKRLAEIREDLGREGGALRARGNATSPARGVGMSFLAELWMFMKVRKKFWLLPILLALLVFGGLVVLTKGSAVAPFIYTLF
jgi:hypothetical protein